MYFDITMVINYILGKLGHHLSKHSNTEITINWTFLTSGQKCDDFNK